MKYITLKDDFEIPALGLGTWELKGDVCRTAVMEALGMGYRYIDTAEAYENQTVIGDVLHRGGIPRSDIFITSKVFHPHLHAADVQKACEDTLRDLQTDYLDLYLIHWPNKTVPMTETFEALLKLKQQGKINMIGVSNFTIHHLQDALAITDQIVNNQVEYHPSLNQKELLQFCNEHKILITAYSPIAQGEDLKNPVIQEIATQYGRPASQVILNWLIGLGMNVIPRSSTKEHLEDNFKALEWILDQKDIERISAIGGNYRIVNPDFNEFDY